MSPIPFVRRALDIEDYLAIVRRNASWIAGPALFGLVSAVVIAYLWPDRYVSEARLRALPPQIPERLVAGPGAMPLADRVNSITQSVLSRNTLTNIIQTCDLYPALRKAVPMEDVVEQMRRDITIGDPSVGGARTAFSVSFAYDNRYSAQRVTRDLVTRLVDESRRGQQRQVSQTALFLSEQADQARAELEAIEQKLTQFNMANVRVLTSQASNGFESLGVMELRTSAAGSALARTQQEKMLLDSELRLLREQVARLRTKPVARIGSPAAGTSASASAPQGRLEREIARMQTEVDLALTRYTSDHPDVQRLRTRLAALIREQTAEAASAPLAPVASVSPGPVAETVAVFDQAAEREIASVEQQIARLTARIRVKDMEAQDYSREIEAAQRRLGAMEQRLSAAPLDSQRLESLTRDHDSAKRRYADIRQRLNQAQESQAVDKNMQGETLELLDPASLPEGPASPTRSLIILGGVILGAVAGCGFAAIRELRDTSLKTLKDIAAYTQFRVFGSVPLLENDMVVRRRKRLALLAWTTACAASVLIMGAAVLYYRGART